MKEPIIQLNNVSFQYSESDQTAVHNITLSIEEGSFVTVLGHNGSGKSTLAKLLNGILLPTEGEVLISGKTTVQEENLLEIRSKVGMVFQNPDNQIVASIVEDDIAFAPENLGVEPAEIRQRVTKALQRVGMEEYRNHAPHLLSGGQKQRIAIAGVLAMQPKVLVLDEPTAMLDPSGRKEVLSILDSLHQEGVTIILITHHMQECIQADRMLVMEKGRLMLDGTPQELFSDAEKLRSYSLDVPATAEVLQKLRAAGIALDSFPLTTEDCAETIYKIFS